MKKNGADLKQWKNFRIKLLTEVADINNPLIMKLEELKLHDLDNLIFQAQELINKAGNETLIASERNIWKQKVSSLVQNLDAINADLNSLSELV